MTDIEKARMLLSQKLSDHELAGLLSEKVCIELKEALMKIELILLSDTKKV